MAKVSVIIPVFNVEDYLDECLESVVNQTLKDIEIICIDDASTDNSYNIIEKYRGKDNRIQIIQNDINKGLSYTRNRGIQFAEGECIYFLDSDDLIELNALEELYNKCMKDNLDIIYFDAKIIYMTEKLKNDFIGYRNTRNNIYNEIYKGSKLFKEFIKNDDLSFSVCRQFYRSDFIKKNDFTFFEGMLHEDNLFTICTIIGADRVVCINKKYFIRRFRTSSIMTKKFSMKNAEGMFNTYYELLKLWEAGKVDRSLDPYINMQLIATFSSAKQYYNMVSYDKRNEPIFLNERYKWNMFYNSIICADNCIIVHEISSIKINEILKAKKVIIFGAGVVGRDVLNILDQYNISVHAFAVTKNENNPKHILRVPVKRFVDLTFQEREALFIVAVTKIYENEIIQYLLDMGIENYIKISD